MVEFRQTKRQEKITRGNAFGPSVTETEEDELFIEGEPVDIAEILRAYNASPMFQPFVFPDPNAERGDN